MKQSAESTYNYLGKLVKLTFNVVLSCDKAAQIRKFFNDVISKSIQASKTSFKLFLTFFER